MRNKKRKFLGQNLSWFVSGALVALLLLSIGPVNGAGSLQGFFAKLVQSRIDAVIESNLLGAFEQLEGQEEKRLGGLVEIFQKIFPEGLIVGTYEKGNSKAQQIIVDSSNNLYIGSSTDATFKIDVTTGRITMRNTNFSTSSLNWGGDLSVDSKAGATPYYTFYADRANGRFGVGTSTPAYQFEMANAADVVLALTATSTNDAVLRFNIGYTGGTSRWLMYADNSDSDNLKIGTSSDADLMTFAYSGGNVTVAKNLSVTGTLTMTGSSAFATTTATRVIQGGGVWTTSTGAVATTTAAHLANFSVWEVTPLNTAATSLYMPATTTLYDYLDANGEFLEFTIHNASTADSSIQFAQGWVNGTDIRTDATSSDVVYIAEDEWLCVKVQRTSVATSTYFIKNCASKAD